MKKILWLSVFVSLALALVLVSCGGTESFTVTFDLGGKSTTSIASQTVEDGKFATRPATNPVPTLRADNFVNWYTAASGGSVFAFATTAITKDTTVYARWETLQDGDLRSIAVETAMDDNEFFVGDAFAVRNLVIEATIFETADDVTSNVTTDLDTVYMMGSQNLLDPAAYEFVAGDVGNKTVTVTYTKDGRAQSTTFVINIKPLPALPVIFENGKWATGITIGTISGGSVVNNRIEVTGGDEHRLNFQFSSGITIPNNVTSIKIAFARSGANQQAIPIVNLYRVMKTDADDDGRHQYVVGYWPAFSSPFVKALDDADGANFDPATMYLMGFEIFNGNNADDTLYITSIIFE